MKTLTQYMNEWKLSDETTNDIELHNIIKPSGNCLEIAVPYYKGGDRMALRVCENYKYDKGTDTIIHIEGYIKYKYYKNKEGYYCFENNERFWRWVLLFSDEAISFLNKLLKNNKHKFNVYNICGSLIETYNVYEFVCKTDQGNFYTKEEIRSMIEKIQ